MGTEEEVNIDSGSGLMTLKDYGTQIGGHNRVCQKI